MLLCVVISCAAIENRFVLRSRYTQMAIFFRFSFRNVPNFVCSENRFPRTVSKRWFCTSVEIMNFLLKPLKKENYGSDSNGSTAKQKVSFDLTVGTRSKQQSGSQQPAVPVRVCAFRRMNERFFVYDRNDSSVFQLQTIEVETDGARKEKVCYAMHICSHRIRSTVHTHSHTHTQHVRRRKNPICEDQSGFDLNAFSPPLLRRIFSDVEPAHSVQIGIHFNGAVLLPAHDHRSIDSSLRSNASEFF